MTNTLLICSRCGARESASVRLTSEPRLIGGLVISYRVPICAETAACTARRLAASVACAATEVAS